MSAPTNSSAIDWKSLLSSCKSSSSSEERCNGLKDLHQRLPVPPQAVDASFQQPLINVLLQAVHDRPSSNADNSSADSVQSLALRSLSHVFSHPSILTSERFEVLRKKMHEFYIRPSTDAKQLFERFADLAQPIVRSIESLPTEATEADSPNASNDARGKDEAAAALRRELRQLKEARKQEEAAEKRRAKAAQQTTASTIPAASAVKPTKSNHTVEDGTESAPFGNFHNYYEFNAPQERLQFIPTQMAECIMQIKASKLQSSAATSTFSYVDVGCNEGDLTMGLLQHLLSGLRGEKNQPTLTNKGELDSTAVSSSSAATTDATPDPSTHTFTAATSSHHPHSGTQIHAIGVDIDPVLIERAQRKVEPFLSHLNTSHALDSNQIITPQPSLQFQAVDIMQPGSVDKLMQMLASAVASRSSSSAASVSSSSSSSSKPFDLICCYSITMWIHLHGGDAGLQYFLRTLSSLTEHLLIEPQPWSCYRNARERWRRSGKEDPAQMATLKWRTEVESEIRTFVEKECGMKLQLELGSTKWKRKVWWFERK